MDMVLQVEEIGKCYPGFALENVTFSLQRNRIMGLIGKNGAGKSTTLKCILNMVHPEKGRVTMFGKDFFQNEKACKQQVGVVFGGIGPLRKFCVSVFRQNQEYHIINVHDWGLFPLATAFPGGWDGMRTGTA